MTEVQAQNYANHKTFDNILIGLLLTFLVCAILSLVSLFRGGGLVGVVLLLLSAGGIGLGIRLRAYATTVQDRVVRLEMRLRLDRVLSEEQRGRASELSLRQLVGLRFASDAELPGLMSKILDENIQKADDIKKLITDWQADDLRV